MPGVLGGASLSPALHAGPWMCPCAQALPLLSVCQMGTQRARLALLPLQTGWCYLL